MPRVREPLPDFSDVHVRLKPVLGIPPGQYLTVIYAVAAVAILFVVLLYPGIRMNGTRVSFRTVPAGAAVWVDGEYRGATPCTVFIPRGERRVELRREFYETVSLERRFRGRLFGSLVFPRRTVIGERLDVADWESLAEWSWVEFSRWGMLRDFSPGSPLPPLLTSLASATRNGGRPAPVDEVIALLADALVYVDSEAEARQVLAALLRAESRDLLLMPAAIGRAQAHARQLAGSADSLPYWFLYAFEDTIRRDPNSPPARLLASERFAAFHQRYLQAVAGAARSATPAAGTAISVAGLTFIPVPAGVLLAGREIAAARERLDAALPYPVRVDRFYMARTELSRAQFSRFLRANPEWAGSDRPGGEAPAADGYLAGWDGANPPAGTADLPVTDVSYHAAEAFSRWLTDQLPQAFAAFEVRLPTEVEWDWAARGGRAAAQHPAGSIFHGAGRPQRVGASAPNALGLQDMWGNVWEWCGDWYYPAAGLLSSSVDPAANPRPVNRPGSERVVKGGSWANTREEIGGHTRGSQPPEWSTPYTGVRVALALRQRSFDGAQ